MLLLRRLSAWRVPCQRAAVHQPPTAHMAAPAHLQHRSNQHVPGACLAAHPVLDRGAASNKASLQVRT